MTVVHVDDEPDFAELTAARLARLDDRFRVVPTTDPDEVLARLADADADVDCVVSDYDMPGVTGLELLERVRASDCDVPFVLFTGKGSEEVASEAIAAGVTEYLRKGYTAERYELLANRVENAVRQYRATKRAAETAGRLRRVYDRITDAVVGIDAEWRYTYVNCEAEKRLEVPAEDIVGEVIWDCFPALRESELGAALREAMAADGGEPVTAVERYGPLDTWFEMRAFPGEDGLSVYFRDVTERRRTRAELARERSILDAALDAVDDVFYIVDEDLNLLRWNGAFDDLTGYSPADGPFDPGAFVLGDGETVRDALRTAVEDRTTVSGEADVVDPEGAVRRFEFVTVPLSEEESGFRGACGIGRESTN